MSSIKSCSDYPEAPSCCESCHEDMEVGMIDVPMEVEVDKKVVARVCCSKYRWLEENPSKV